MSETCPEGVIGGRCEPVCARCGRDMTERRLNLDGRDPATFTELEKLAYAYPAVYTLMRDRDRWRERARDRDALLMDAITVMDDLSGTRRALARRSVLFRRLARIALERLR